MAASDRFDVPPEMRAFAEKSVEQARQAFDGFISAAHQAMSAFEGQAETARKGAKDVTEKAMTFAERNIASAFEFAQELVRARDVQDVLRLQADYIKRQMQALTEQARELGRAPARRQRTRLRRSAEVALSQSRPKKKLTRSRLDCAAQYFCCIAPNAGVYPPTSDGCGVSDIRTTATGLLSPKHGSAVGAGPCDAGSSPSKGSIYDRGHRNDRIQVQIQGGPASRVRNAEIRTAEF
jgi:phasin